MKFKIPIKRHLKFFILLATFFSIGIIFGQRIIGNTQNKPQISIEKNTPKAFISEVYDKIKENYWNNISDAELLNLFKLSIDKQSLRSGELENGGNLTVVKFENKDKLLDSIIKSTEGMNEDQKIQFISNMVGSVLASLAPSGRSGLYTQKQEEQLKNTVSNINPEKDLYKDLGLAKGASGEAIQQAYATQAAKLSQDKSPEAAEKLKTLTYAKETLTQKDTKQRYDTNQVEPTFFTKVFQSSILYLQFKKFSPSSLDEFQKVFESYKNDQNLNALIFDLRGNIGGAIDETAYFLGYFLGKGQYAFDFYHKGDFLPFKTPTDKLPSVAKYKQVIVLIDQNTQSSAEMMAASLKRYHIGVILGAPTKGWGTVERVFPLDNQISQKERFSLFLVHSITLRDDNQPIEGRGVDPDVSIKDPDWQQKLLSYFNNPALVGTVKNVVNP